MCMVAWGAVFVLEFDIGWMKCKVNYFLQQKLMHPKLLDGLNYESKGKDDERRKSWGVLPRSQHFGGKGVCWSFEMGIRKIDKKFNYSHGPAQTKQQVG